MAFHLVVGKPPCREPMHNTTMLGLVPVGAVHAIGRSSKTVIEKSVVRHLQTGYGKLVVLHCAS